MLRRESTNRQRLIGHRGACAYAPEHTLESYALAVQLGADAVEQDLHLTKDGVVVCLHDFTLERTTDTAHIFPTRAREVVEDGRVVRRWFVHDFSVAEIKQVDAGSWFGEEFVGARIPTFQEVIDSLVPNATLCTELKDPERYERLGLDLVSAVAALLRANDLDRPRSGESPVILQSFHEPTVRRAATCFDQRVPLVLLIEPSDVDQWRNRHRMEDLAAVADGLGPGKALLEAHPDFVRWAHDAGLRVSPWTFRANAPGRYDSVQAEMAHHLFDLRVDAVITDNPDQFPRQESHRP
jgi:glycerophosphoryl diester phosphodiesterase